MDEQSFLTPHAREVANARLPRRPNEQFERIYEVKFKEVKRFYDAGGGRLITVGTDHPSWGEFLSGFGSHRELQAFVLAGIPPAAALKMATINGARALGVGDELGIDRSRQARGSVRRPRQSARRTSRTRATCGA